MCQAMAVKGPDIQPLFHHTSCATGASEDACILQEVALESSPSCGFLSISQESNQKLRSPDHLGNQDRVGGDKRLWIP